MLFVSVNDWLTINLDLVTMIDGPDKNSEYLVKLIDGTILRLCAYEIQKIYSYLK